MDVVRSGTDYSREEKFTETVAKKIYYGPVYLRGGPEPHVTLGLASTRSDAGVSVAELNLNLMWEIVQQTKIGDHGVAYVVNAYGRVIGHSDSDLSKSLQDFSSLAHVREARTPGCPESVRIAHDMNDREVVAVCARRGARLAGVCRAADGRVDKILKGAKPDLPGNAAQVRTSVINLKTAKAIAFTIPESILFV